MRIVYTEEFQKQLKKLPKDIQVFYHRQEKIFRVNWRDPCLHIKKLTDHPFPFSFRITRNYRVLFIFVQTETVLFATIGNRKDIYRKQKENPGRISGFRGTLIESVADSVKYSRSVGDVKRHGADWSKLLL